MEFKETIRIPCINHTSSSSLLADIFASKKAILSWSFKIDGNEFKIHVKMIDNHFTVTLELIKDKYYFRPYTLLYCDSYENKCKRAVLKEGPCELIRFRYGEYGYREEIMIDFFLQYKERNQVKKQPSLLSDDQFADFIIRSENPEEQIKVHKNVLAHRSPVFRRMFSSNMIEAEKSELIIKDFEWSRVKAFIQVLYDETLKEDSEAEEIAKDILKLAHMYQVFDLHHTSAKWLTYRINKENLKEYYHLAKIYSNEILMKAVLASPHRDQVIPIILDLEPKEEEEKQPEAKKSKIENENEAK